MVRLVPLFLVGLLIASGLSAGETSIQDALEKARRRAGGPASSDKAKQEKAKREKAWRQKLEEKYRKERDEEIRKAKEAEAAKKAEAARKSSAPAEPAKKTIRIFTLKNGTQINAVMVVELQDTYALKDTDGKLHEVKKDDVKSIKDEEKDPG